MNIRQLLERIKRLSGAPSNGLLDWIMALITAHGHNYGHLVSYLFVIKAICLKLFLKI